MNFDKVSKSEERKCGVEGWGVGGNTKTKPVSQTVQRGKIKNSNHLHNVKNISVANPRDFLIPCTEFLIRKRIFCMNTSTSKVCIFPDIFITKRSDQG